MVERVEEIKKQYPARRIVVHTDFLTDYALLFFDSFLCKKGMLNKIEQNLKRLVKFVGAGKEIAGLVKRSVGVCRSARLGKTRKGVSLLTFKKLMLEKMSDSLRYNCIFSILFGLECVIKDGVAFLGDFTAFAGSVATADRLVRVMYKDAGIDLCSVIKMITKTPARIMNLEKRGEICEGNFADLVFFDDDINIKKVIIEGKELK